MKTLNQMEPRTPILFLPFTVSKSGSYYLTGSLAGSNGFDGIVIAQDDVHLDLRGFSLIGTPFSSNGIVVVGNRHNISVRNGVVRGWRLSGIDIGTAHESELANVTAFTNGVHGMVIGINAVLEQCGAFKNLSNGIQAGSGATVMNCKARDNGGRGIVVDSMSRVSQCGVARNAGTGIDVAQFCQVLGCGSSENGLHGISADSDSRIIENACSMNNPLAGAGINIYGKGNRIEGNNVTQNRYGILFAPLAVRNLLVGNSASGNTNNYWGIGASNAFGSLINMSGGGVISNAGSWSNFEF